WALMHELRGEAEPALESILARLTDCDIVLVEGYKRAPHQKIETRRVGASQTVPLAESDPNIVAIASDRPQPNESLPVFDLGDISAIADFIERATALAR